MSAAFKVACIQNCADDDLTQNLAETEALCRAARAAGAELICLPENFSLIQVNDAMLLAEARSEETHPAIPRFRTLARELRAWILLGSLSIKVESGKLNNRSYLIDSDGHITAVYDKIHPEIGFQPRTQIARNNRSGVRLLGGVTIDSIDEQV